MMHLPIKYLADLSNVSEISLVGTADLEPWADRLRPEGLVPAELTGRAQILIIAAAARFRGMAFRELSFSVEVERSDRLPGRSGSHLFHAANSNRFFASCERTFFSTPYRFGTVQVTALLSVAMRLEAGGMELFRAEMPVGTRRELTSRHVDGWEGPVFLPGGDKVFFARIEGETWTYPFLDSEDSLIIQTASGHESIRLLLDSGFRAERWVVRPDARHAKSQTIRRAAPELRGATLAFKAADLPPPTFRGGA